MIEARIDTSEVQRLTKELKKLGNKEAANVVRRAINRAIDSTYTEVSRKIRAEYNIKTADIKTNTKKKKATGNRPSAYLSISGRLLSMAHFSFTPKTPQPRRRPMAKVKIKKGKFVPTSKASFVARSNNALNVFTRFTSNRLPIAPLRTISIPQMVSSKKIMPGVEEKAQEVLQKRLDYELQRAMDKVKGGG